MTVVNEDECDIGFSAVASRSLQAAEEIRCVFDDI